MPIELWLLAVVLLLLVVVPLGIVWLDMVQGYLGTTGQLLAAWWLIGALYLGATTLKLELAKTAACVSPNVEPTGARLQQSKRDATLAARPCWAPGWTAASFALYC